MKEGFSFFWRTGSAPYLVTPDNKIVVLDVLGDIPFLKPGDPLCQPREPSDEYPLDGMGGSSCVPRFSIPVSPSAPDDNGGQVDGVPAGYGSADGAVL